MKSIYEMYGTVSDYEVDGVWQDLGPVRVKLARSGGKNTSYLKALKNVMKRFGKKNFDAVSDDESIAIMIEVFAKSVIKDFEVKDEDGNWVQGIPLKNEIDEIEVMPYSIKNVSQCLSDLPDMFRDLQKWADDIKTFQKEVEEEQAKN